MGEQDEKDGEEDVRGNVRTIGHARQARGIKEGMGSHGHKNRGAKISWMLLYNCGW